MGRVSARYNHRLSKTKKESSKTVKKLSPDKVVIRNKKTAPPHKTKTNKSSVTSVRRTLEPRATAILKQSKKNITVNGSVSIEDFKDYCKGKTVLLVGNARDIVKQKYGSQIDSYDIIVRMNHGHPIAKYAKNMGTKYSIWSHGFLSQKKQITEYGKIKKRIDFHIETNEQKLCKRIFDKKAFLIPKKWYKVGYEKKSKGKEMSTGLNTAFFFVDWVGTMSEISIVGFDFLKTGNAILQSASARKFHDTAREEKEMIDLLSKSGKYLPFNENYNFAK